MILWTVMPIELVVGQEEYSNPYEEIEYDGVTVQVERCSDRQYRIVRLISTDPSHFLRLDLQPGSTLTYKPVYD